MFAAQDDATVNVQRLEDEFWLTNSCGLCYGGDKERHLGRTTTISSLRHRAYWQGMGDSAG